MFALPRLVRDSRAPVGSVPILALSALGVVFGDIGTSPLYTFKIVLTLAGEGPDQAIILGTCSLIIWTSIIVATIKYVSFAMRMDNYGEGGILSLMALIGTEHGRRFAIIAIGLFGAALIYGDGESHQLSRFYRRSRD